MRNAKVIFPVLLALFAVALIPSRFSVRGAGAPIDFAVIASSEVPIDNLSVPEVRKLFLGDRQFWTPGLRVNLLVRAPVARERAVVVWTICKMSEAQFGHHWMSKVMRAECTTVPRQFTSNQMAIDMVRAIPGAVAIVNASQVPQGLKILSVNGHKPGERGYPLQLAD